MEDYRQKV